MVVTRVKVRTVTSLMCLTREVMRDDGELDRIIEQGVKNNKTMESELVARGFEVQSLRISTNSFEDYLSIDDDHKFAQELELIRNTLSRHGANFFNFGPARSAIGLSRVPSLLESMELAFASCDLLPSQSLDEIDLAWMGKVADCCSTLADVHRLLYYVQNMKCLQGGSNNFRFCAFANVSQTAFLCSSSFLEQYFP
uniref:Uncharacterized protein n=1 Tax=Guillardia theta TaxID=55529 RepID=A0A6U6DCM6_GUITH|mmetsp:Transcript_5435/g.19121  ORF Transcript_5435/g.19121 Transcript_5435/m.19121 type:complete len:197 (+) Transcript_5435:65-655(+)